MAVIYTNSKAKSWNYQYPTDISLAQSFHKQLPGFEATPLIALDALAKEFGVQGIYVKDESSRLGLPAFKILGASWGTFRAIMAKTGLSLNSSLDDASRAAQQTGITLYAATEGNHGRAVARMGNLLSIPTKIFVGEFTDEQVKDNIASENAHVTVLQGNYDEAVAEANRCAQKDNNGVLVQDNAFNGYEEVPAWIVEGYSTLLQEVEQQLEDLGLKATIIVTPIGVGSLGHAVVAHCKSNGRDITVLTAEPETSACLYRNLKEGKFFTIKTSKTIMDGMNCGTVSPISWPILNQGVDASVIISDRECHESVRYLQSHGVNAGPCGAGTLAALKKVVAIDGFAISLSSESVIVLLSTEGKRYYAVPS